MDGTVENFPTVKGGNVKTVGAAADALPLRSDDTLEVFTYKLQQLLGARVYWWVKDHSGQDRCPFVVNGGSGREPVNKGARVDTDTFADLFETHAHTNVVNVMRTSVLLQLNPHLKNVVGVDPAASADPSLIRTAEKALCGGGRAGYVGKITSYVYESPCVVTERDLKIFSTAPMSPACTMYGIRSLDTCRVRVTEGAIKRRELSITDAQAAAERLVRSKGVAFLVTTWIDEVACVTLVEDTLMRTSVKAEMPNLAAAGRASGAAKDEVHKLRKTRCVDQHTNPTVSISMVVLFSSLKFSKGELLEALHEAGSVLHSEPQMDGSVVVHLKRVPRFVATSSHMQFLDSYSHMLEEGRFSELGRRLAKEFGLAPDDARCQVSEYARTREAEASAVAVADLHAVGATAVLKVGSQGLRASVRSDGNVAFADRILWLIGGLQMAARSGPPTARGGPTTGIRRQYRPENRGCQCGAEIRRRSGVVSEESIQFGEGNSHYKHPDWRRRPLEIRAPCSFNTRSGSADLSQPLSCGVRGPLPPSLPPWAFGSAVRVGVAQDTDPVSNAVCCALQMERRELVERVTGMGVLQVVRIAQGHLIQRFIDPSQHTSDPRVSRRYRAFKHSAAGRTYARQVGQPDEVRDFALWNGYTNIMDYMVQGRARDHLFIAPLLEAALQVGIVVLQHTDAGVSLHCPYEGPAMPSTAKLCQVAIGLRPTLPRLPVRVVILKRGDTYEPLANVSDETLARLGELAARVRRAAPTLGSPPNEELIRLLVDREGLEVEKQVVSHGFEAVGVLASGLFVPYLFPAPYDPLVPMVFANVIQTSSERWTLEKVVALFKRLEKSSCWYRNHEVLQHGGSVTVRAGGHFIPVADSGLIVKLAHRNVIPFASEQSLELAKIRELMITHLIAKHPIALSTAKRESVRPGAFTELEAVEEGVRALINEQRVPSRADLVADDRSVCDGTFLCMLRTLIDGHSIIADLRSAWNNRADRATVFTRVGVGQKSWRAATSDLQLLTSEELGMDCLAEVVEDLGGPKLDREAFARIVARVYLMALDTGVGAPANNWPLVREELKRSTMPIADVAYRCAEGSVPTAVTAAAVLGMCDVNVLAVSDLGHVVGQHASNTDRYVLCFEQPRGGVAFASVDGSRVLSKSQLSITMAARF
jgi:hypothetical protein